MSDIAPAIQMFQARIREKLPAFAALTSTAVPDGFGNFTLLDVPCPSSPSRCRLGVLFRRNCFEIFFCVAEARGPAELQIIIANDLAGTVAETVDFLRGIVTGRILIDVFRHRLLWFQPYYSAHFREASDRPRGRIFQTLCWRANGEGKDICQQD